MLLVSLMLLVKLFLYYICKSLSLFLLWWGGWGLIESICHLVYCHPALNGDRPKGILAGIFWTYRCRTLHASGSQC